MNIALRYPELGKEIRITVTLENYLEEINYHLQSLFGSSSESFILLNEEGLSIKDKNIPKKSSELIYIFSKDSIKKEKSDTIIEFSIQKSVKETQLPGETRGPLIVEKELFELYQKSSEKLDFLNSYSLFAKQLETEMAIISSSNKVLELYHIKHIQDQIDSFNNLNKKNEIHIQMAQFELAAFEDSVKSLETFKIHEKLRAENRENLAQLIDLTQLTKWKETYVSEIARLQAKFEDLEKVVKDLPNKFQLPKILQNNFKAPCLTEEITNFAKYPVDLYLEYRGLCDSYLNKGNASAGARLHEEKWEQKIAQAKFYLERLEENMPNLKQSIENMKLQRKTANLQLFGLLRKITEFAAKIRDTVKSQLSMLSSLLKRSEKRLAFIKVPKLLPEAHASTIIEISRRNYFTKAATELRDKLNLLIDTEISERMMFLEKYRHVLPNNFVPQLSAAPFIKIISAQDEPDLSLPQIFEFVPTNPIYLNKPTGNSECNDKLSEEFKVLNEKYKECQENVRISKHEIMTLKNELMHRERENIKYQNVISDLETEVNQKIQLQELIYEEKTKSLNQESMLTSKIKELEGIIKQLSLKNNSVEEQIQKIKNQSQENLKELQEKYMGALKIIQEKEAQVKKDVETIKKLSNEVQSKDSLILQTVQHLDKLKSEFESREKVMNELKNELDFEKRQKRSNNESVSAEFQEFCNSLNIDPSIRSLQSHIASIQEDNMSKISFTHFKIGSLALFFPTSEGQFLAFNYNCPDHYLDLDSLNEETLTTVDSVPYIVGLITNMQMLVAEKSNPIGLPQGHKFYLISIKEQQTI